MSRVVVSFTRNVSGGKCANEPFSACVTAESLRRHVRTHDENHVKKSHVCEICSKQFRYPSFLAEHMKNHTGEKPFLCSVCGKGFRQSGTLHYHMRSHTGSKPFVCKICGNSFGLPGNDKSFSYPRKIPDISRDAAA